MIHIRVRSLALPISFASFQCGIWKPTTLPSTTDVTACGIKFAQGYRSVNRIRSELYFFSQPPSSYPHPAKNPLHPFPKEEQIWGLLVRIPTTTDEIRVPHLSRQKGVTPICSNLFDFPVLFRFALLAFRKMPRFLPICSDVFRFVQKKSEQNQGDPFLPTLFASPREGQIMLEGRGW